MLKSSVFFLPFSCLLIFIAVSSARADKSETAIPNIIVTTEWREVDSQKTASTVDTFSAQSLDAAGVQNTQSLQMVTPGLVFSSSEGVGQVFLRGIGGKVSAVDSSRVAVFSDGAYLPRAVQSMQELYDIKRIEIIKGPHGVHLGRNVVGGAVSLITHEPQLDDAEIKADVLSGGFNQQRFRGAVNVPVGERSAVRLAGVIAQRDGYSRNAFLNKDADDQGYYGLRGKWRYQASDQFDMTIGFEKYRQEDRRGIAAQPDLAVGINATFIGATASTDPRKVYYDNRQLQDNENTVYHLRLNWQFDDLTLQSISTSQKTDQTSVLDLDKTDISFSTGVLNNVGDTVSQEVRLSNHASELFGWTLGTFFIKEDIVQQQDIRLPLTFVQNFSINKFTTDSWAVFGELNIDFTDQWQGRIGLRYNKDETHADQLQTVSDPFGVQGLPGIFVIPFQDKHDWTALTPELLVSYSPDSSTFYYGKVARGYKAGGYSTFAIQPAYNPEFMLAYEAGVKQTFKENTAGLNMAAFFYDYTDMQLLTLPANAPLGTLPNLSNAGKSSVTGLELQTWYQPEQGIKYRLGLTLLNAEFKQFNSVDSNNPLSDPDRAGDPLPASPDVSLSFGVQYRWSQILNGDIEWGANYKYQSETYFNPYRDEAVRQGEYGLANTSLSYTNYKSDWGMELFVNNITDKLYAQNILRFEPTVGTTRYWGEPRTVGIRIHYSFSP